MSFGIYIHWPFCLSKCPYCDFYKEVRKDIPQDEIIAAYLRDLDFYLQYTKQREVTSIFFGGGTPSLIKPENIEKVINHIYKNWAVAKDMEISLEANPNSDYSQMFSQLRKAGINRLSLGVQALNDTDLRFLGRTHNCQQALQSIDEVLKNFDNHSIDLIYARPEQKLENWQKELQQAVSLGMKHISLYQLTIEEGTFFAKKGIQPLDEEAASEMYLFTNAFLEEAGYLRYEVSNYAQARFESRHNMLYWQGDDFIGVGKSAAGRLSLDNKSGGKVFYATTHRCELEELSKQEKAEELLLMGLRLVAGIDKIKFKDVCGLDFDKFINQDNLISLQKDGLVENQARTLKATAKGFLVLNKIIEKLV